MKLELTSPAFKQGEPIPEQYTCDGEEIPPTINIADIPNGTRSLALIMDDPDAPAGTWVHWVMWNIAPNDTIHTGTEGKNSWDNNGYGGPCPPSGTHRYFFRVYALDTALNIPETSGAKDLMEAMEGHILAKGELMGTGSAGHE